MALVTNKCPSCGANMKMVNNQLVCDSCGTTVFQILETKLDKEIPTMSPEEFERKIGRYQKRFIVTLNQNLSVLDVDLLVTNKKIKDATEQLARGEYEEVKKTVGGYSGILSVERLLFLADFEAHNEYEVSQHFGYIHENVHYQNVLKLADEETRKTYRMIADFCRERYDDTKRLERQKAEINEEVRKVDRLIKVDLKDEAIAYIEAMMKKYPENELAMKYYYDLMKEDDAKRSIAFRYYATFMKTHPDNALAMQYCYELSCNDDNIKKNAIEAFETVIALRPQSIRAMVYYYKLTFGIRSKIKERGKILHIIEETKEFHEAENKYRVNRKDASKNKNIFLVSSVLLSFFSLLETFLTNISDKIDEDSASAISLGFFCIYFVLCVACIYGTIKEKDKLKNFFVGAVIGIGILGFIILGTFGIVTAVYIEIASSKAGRIVFDSIALLFAIGFFVASRIAKKDIPTPSVIFNEDYIFKYIS